MCNGVKFSLCAILAIINVNTTVGIRQEFQLYTGFDQTGDGLIVRNKQSNLTSLSPEIVTDFKSYCLTGFWSFYNETNFGGSGLDSCIYIDGPFQRCGNCTCCSTTQSARFWGPSDLNVTSITFYQGRYMVGEELILSDEGYPSIPFSPLSMFSTGGSNWTFFSDVNYEGTRICYMSRNIFHGVLGLNSTFSESIRSVDRGCDTSKNIDFYIYADEIEE